MRKFETGPFAGHDDLMVDPSMGSPQYILFFMYCIYWLIIQKMNCFCFAILSHTISCHRVVSIRKGSFRFTPRKPRSQASPQWRVPKPFHLSHQKRQQLEASSEHFLGWPISFVWTFIGFSWNEEWWFTLKIVFVPLFSDTPRHCSQMFSCLGQALGFLWCQNSGQRLRHHSGRVTANFPTSISFTKAVYAPCVLYIYPTRVIFWVQKWLGNYHLPAPSSLGKYAVRNCPIGFLRSDRPEPPVVTRRKTPHLVEVFEEFWGKNWPHSWWSSGVGKVAVHPRKGIPGKWDQ